MSDNPFNNEAFREEFEGTLDRKLKPITGILAKHEADIDRHEASLNRAYGGIGAFVFIQSVGLAIWEWFKHK